MEPTTSDQKTVRMTFRRIFTNILVFVLLIGLTFFFVFKDQNPAEILQTMLSANYLFIALGVLLMLGYFSVEAWNIRSILLSFGERLSFFKALKFTLIGFFFCSVTPGASGGQPLEIYYMTKEKISGAHATMALLVQICGVQISVMLLGIIGMIAVPEILTGGVFWLTIVGMLINGFALAVLLVCVFSQKLTRKVVNACISIIKFFGYKKIEQKRKSIDKSLEQYNEGSKFIKSHKKAFVVSILRVLLQMSLYFLVPFCVYKAFGLSGTSLLELFFMQAVLFMATSGLPLPGAIGASETAFLSIYGAVFGEELLGSATLLNRGINFYWFVIISLIVVFINIIRLKSLSNSANQNSVKTPSSSAKK